MERAPKKSNSRKSQPIALRSLPPPEKLHLPQKLSKSQTMALVSPTALEVPIRHRYTPSTGLAVKSVYVEAEA